MIIGNARAGLSRSKLPHLRWSSEDPKLRVVQVRFPFKAAQHAPYPTLSLNCRKFLPSSNDVLDDVWEAADGEQMVIVFPPYACVRPLSTSRDISPD